MSADETTAGNDGGAPACRADKGRPVVVPGVLVQVCGLGVLIMGDSGIGKTACALDLIARGCFWIADDAIVLERRGGALYGRGHERTRDLIAVLSRGLLNAGSVVGAEALLKETQVHVIVQFTRRFHGQGADRDVEGESFLDIEGLPVRCRRVAAVGGSGLMADEVIACVNRYLGRRERGSKEQDNEQADARGNHHGTVRFR